MAWKTPLAFLCVVALALVFGGCGDVGEEESPTISHEEYAFKHGPGPGPPYTYILTTFKDPTMACVGTKKMSYYSTGAWMFGCGTKLKVQANGKCVVVQVADNGPAAWVESNAKSKCSSKTSNGYVLDVDPKVSSHLFGTSSSGWSDCRAVQAWKVPSSTKTGPVSCGSIPVDGDKWIGESCDSASDCSTGKCLTSNYPDGMCSQSCTKICPDSSGKTTTFCVALDQSNGYCYSQCDYDKYSSGCRSGYECVTVPRHNDPGTLKDACFPSYYAGQAKALTGGDAGDTDVWIGGACESDSNCASGLFCETDEHDDGMCTKQCPSNSICPDRAGEPTTFCVALDQSTGYCYSRCDYDKYSSGCRSGYACKKMPRHEQDSVKRNTCIPESAVGKGDFFGEEPDEEGELPNPEDTFTRGCSVGSSGLDTGLPGLLLALCIGLWARRRRRSR